jgi:hypothetical protein
VDPDSRTQTLINEASKENLNKNDADQGNATDQPDILAVHCFQAFVR